ncbi:HxlR family transcriptional regulator [Noviherbaspirillum denitrificans]|uniref:HxlR family transcriptional regulator n=2 Tax=Noviherbaspirillum denitrificans TaxID=1968433 RepID=A0A254TJV2_9BURK|nr:HxlR family transcriptional regulator [Noviherbaspirillum denitrificans]
MNCSIARALDQIGEWWSLLIVRECTFGTTRFDQFQERLGIARNILTNRLKRLIDVGILEKVALGENDRRAGYRLTQKGEELFPVLVALLQWGDKWGMSLDGPPIRLVEHATGEPLAAVGPYSSSGRLLGIRDVRMEVGPGGTPSTEAVVAARNLAILGAGSEPLAEAGGQAAQGSAPARKPRAVKEG